jgi:hypothetical protein
MFGAAQEQGEAPPAWLADAPRAVQLKGGDAPARVYAPRAASEDEADSDDCGGPAVAAPLTPPVTESGGSSPGESLDELRRTSSGATSTRSSSEQERRSRAFKKGCSRNLWNVTYSGLRTVVLHKQPERAPAERRIPTQELRLAAYCQRIVAYSKISRLQCC